MKIDGILTFLSDLEYKHIFICKTFSLKENSIYGLDPVVTHTMGR